MAVLVAWGKVSRVSHWNALCLVHQSASGQKLAVVFFWVTLRKGEGHFEGVWAPHGREGHFEGEWGTMGGRGTLRESGHHGREGAL